VFQHGDQFRELYGLRVAEIADFKRHSGRGGEIVIERGKDARDNVVHVRVIPARFSATENGDRFSRIHSCDELVNGGVDRLLLHLYSAGELIALIRFRTGHN
jgi:hypothetical protein